MSRQTFDNLNKSIDALEKTAGKDIHSDKWKRCVEHVKEKGDVDNAYAVCTDSLGQDSFKSFAKSDDLTNEDLAKINMMLLHKATTELESLTKGIIPKISSQVPVDSARVNVLITPSLDMLWGGGDLPRAHVSWEPPELNKDK